MTLRLRNTLTRVIEPVAPLEPGRVRMYTCGPTVYRYAHVGNLRSNLLADLIRRVLEYHGVDVVHVKNITDVGHLRDDRFDRGEDRMLVQAGLEDRSSAEIANAYEAAFHADEAVVNILPAAVFPRATEHIPEMIELAERLEDLGLAYRSGAGNLYYSVAAFPGYGELSGNTLDALRAGHRGQPETDKRDAADFALWKSAGPDRELRWPSRRWGDGFPGWHLECSAMARRYLGDRFDIHTGGIDNVFPHHEDEIAQSAPLVGGPPATLWVHGEHLLMAGRKMAKSAGNFQRITELVDDGLDPLAFRYLVLTSRYGHKLDYSDASIEGAAAGLASLRSRLATLGPPPAGGPWAAPTVVEAATGGRSAGRLRIDATRADTARTGRTSSSTPLSSEGRSLHDRFVAALDDDLDLPVALVCVREMLRVDLPADERRWLVLDADAVLGLDLHRTWDAARTGRDATPGDRRPTRGARPGPFRARLRARRRDPGRDRGPRLGGGRRTRRFVPAPTVLTAPVGQPPPKIRTFSWSSFRQARAACASRSQVSASVRPSTVTWFERESSMRVASMRIGPSPSTACTMIASPSRRSSSARNRPTTGSTSSRAGSSAIGVRHEEVAPRPEPVDDPVEVPLRLSVTLVVGQARPAAVLVSDERQVRERDRAAGGGGPLPFGIAQDEAPPDVEVAVEAEALVERAGCHVVRAPERLADSPRWHRRRRVVRPRTSAGRPS